MDSNQIIHAKINVRSYFGVNNPRLQRGVSFFNREGWEKEASQPYQNSRHYMLQTKKDKFKYKF